MRTSGDWQVLLDETPLRTPSGQPLLLPRMELAESIAGEWRNQGEEIRPDTMQFTRLANTAIDRVAPNRRAIIAELLKFAATDLLCFRASAPDALVNRQSAVWDPLLEWATERYGIELQTLSAIAAVRGTPHDLGALEAFISKLNDFVLAGLFAACSSLGSAILTLALFEGWIDAEQAFAAAEFDAIYQAEIWGTDPLMTARMAERAKELIGISTFFALARAF